MVVVVARLRIHVAAMQQEAHREEVLVSRRGLGGSSSYGCRYFCMGLWMVACVGHTALACSATKSLTEGTLGQCSPWCSMD